jgi:hypothetical protein
MPDEVWMRRFERANPLPVEQRSVRPRQPLVIPRALLAGWIGALLLVSSCGDGSSGDRNTGASVRGIFVGKVADTDALVAVVGGSEAAVAAVVDGAAGIAEPFGGTRSSEDVVLDSKNGAHLEVRLSPDGGSGSVTLAGAEYSIALRPATGRAGLYRAGGKVDGEPVWIVWVVLGDGEQRGAAGTPIGIVAAPLLDTSTQSFTVEGVTSPVADVQPDQPAGMIENPGSTFAGGSGFSGGISQFGGFNTFGCQSGFGGGFSGGFCQFSGSFGGFGGKGFGFGGGGFTPDVLRP